MLYLKNAIYIDYKTLDFKKSNILVRTRQCLVPAPYLQTGQAPTHTIDFIPDIPSNIKKENIIDCEGMFVTKSFACGHHHAYSALARGMPSPKKNPENFHEILKYIWWNLDKCLDKEMIEKSALYTAIACAKSGSTFVIDHHASPYAIDGSLDMIASAFDKIGISHLLCYEVSDRDGKGIAEKGLSETENYLKNKQGLVGLHASFTVGDESLKKAVNIAEKYSSGIHIHAAEDNYDQTDSIKKYGKRVIERLNDFGALDFPSTILAHCLHIDENERKIIRKSKCIVVQNTESNLNNNVGFFNSEKMGKNIMLGTDGMHSDMLKSAKASFFIGQAHDSIDFASTYDRFRNAHNYIKNNGFCGDEDNNLVVLDYDSPTEINKDNFLGHFIYGIESKHIRHVISSGEIIVKDYKVQNINEEEFLEQSREISTKLWSRMKK